MSANEDRLTESLRALSRFFVGDGTVQETLQKVADLANEAVEGSDMVGLTMGVDGRVRTAVFTDEAAPEIDQSQYETGIGPCLDAFRTGKVNWIPSTEKDTTWPPFSEACDAHGILSTLSMPVVANGEGLGALNFYSRTRDAFTGSDPTAEAFATQAAVVLANAQAYWDARTLSEQLSQAMQSRATIEQAKGIIMATGKTADEAFQVLVRASQRENRKLREIAQGIVDEAVRRAQIPS